MKNRHKKSALSLLLALALVIGLIGSSGASVSSYAANVDLLESESEESSVSLEAEKTDSEEAEEAEGNSDGDDSEDKSDDSDGNVQDTAEEDTGDTDGDSDDNAAEEETEEEAEKDSEDTSGETSSDDDTESTDDDNYDNNSEETTDDESDSDDTSDEEDDVEDDETDSEDEEDDAEDESESEEEVDDEEDDEDESDSDGIGQVTFIPDASDLADNDELFSEYFFDVLYEGLEEVEDSPAAVANWGNEYFPDGSASYSLYSKLKSAVEDVAANGGSTVFSYTLSTKFTYTITDADDEDTAIADMKSAFGEDVHTIIKCLMVDCPYELYWYDKTESTSNSFYYSTTNIDSGWKFTITSVAVTMPVATAYQGSSNTEVDSSTATSAAKTVDAANNVVSEYSEESDYDKLVAYKDWICAEVSYNSDAADDSNDYDYGDPWQIIYVFDGDEDTNVVCEGYSKAFQYLCDLSSFEGDIVCYTVNGDMNGGGHMWNIVKMDDGNYYHVDVTNSDSGTSGKYGGLFLNGWESGSVDEGYYMKIQTASVTSSTYSYVNKSIEYVYDEDIIALYGYTILTLSSDDYPEISQITITDQSSDMELVYGDTMELWVTVSAPSEVETVSYYWFGTASSLLLSTKSTLTRSNMKVGTYGYYCIAYDADTGKGTVSDTITVTITPQPITDISEVVGNVAEPEAGESVQTSVDVPDDANYTAELSWDSEDTTYASGTEYTATLTLTVSSSNYTFSDETVVPDGWSAEVSDDGGTIVLTRTYVTDDKDDKQSSVVIKTQPDNVTITSGEEVELTVEAYSTDEDAELTYQWYLVKDDEDEAVDGGTDSTLALTNLDVGTYQYYCVVSDGTDSVISDTVTVTVEEPETAEITDVSEVSSLVTAPVAGESAQTTVTVPADANYTAEIAWNPEDATYDYATEYTVTLTLTAEENYVFSDSVVVPDGWDAELSDDGTVLTLTYTYDATAKIDISGATVSVSPDSYTYTGSAIEPTAVTVTLEDGTSLTEGEDYTLSYSDNTDAGTATVTATGAGKYEGTASATFMITGASLEKATVTLSPSSFTYSGETNRPTVTVALDGTTLTEGTDYSVSYSDDLVNVGTVTVTITGTGNYTGTVAAAYTIAAASIADATVTLPDDGTYSYTYSGSAKEPTPSVSVDGVTLTKDTDYTVTYSDNTDAGTATVTITGIGNYTGKTSVTFTITAVSIDNAAVTLSDSTYTYDGSAKEPVPTVVVSGTALTESTDYTVSYSDNTDAGTATVTVTGIGNYTGSTSVMFTIEAASVASASVTLPDETYIYDGDAKEPEPTVIVGGTTLTKNTDYLVSYSDNVNAGTATVTIEGTGNYIGTTAIEFTISAASISDADVTVSPESYTYTGDTITPTLSVELDGTALTEGTDYTVSFEDDTDNINVGTVTVTISGTGNYTGSTTASFEITAASIADAGVELSEDTFTYTGTEKTPSVTVTLSGKTLTEEADYTVSYSNNIDAGTAKVTITGTGNYTGTKTVTFVIEAAEITDVSEVSGMVSAPTGGQTVQTLVELVEGIHYTASLAWTPVGTVYEYETEYTAVLTLTAADNYVFSETVSVPDNWTSELSEDGTVLVLTYTFAATDAEPEGLVITGQPEDQTVEYGEEVTLTVTATTTNANAVFSYQWYQVSGDDEAEALDGEVDSTLTLSGLAVGSYQYYCIVSDGIDDEKSSTASVTVAAKSIAEAVISLSATTYTYSGSVNEPAVTVTLDDGTILIAGTDYTVSYEDNTDAGTATVIITGAGNYAGTVEVTFTIAAASIEDAEVTLEPGTFTYSGSVNEPAVTVTLDESTVLIAGTDYTVSYENNVNAGTAVAYIIGAGNYEGTIEAVFTIGAASIGNAELSLSETDYTYSGTAKEPAVTVSMNGTVLTEDTDYTVSYSNNVDAGTASVTVTGMGNYTGTAGIDFIIAKASLIGAEVSLSETTYPYNGSACEPGVTVIVSGTTLTVGTDYTVSYTDNTEVGTATVTVTGTGNYTGSASVSFTIEAISIAEAEITLSETAYTYSGKANTPEVVVVLAETELVEGTDYEVSYSDNVIVGTATVVVTGIGNYTGSLSTNFSILAASIDGAEVTVSVSEVTYSGEANRPTVSVTLDGTELTEGTDYTVSYADNVNVGTATITVTGAGNYTGTLEVNFTITAASVEDAEVTLLQTAYLYTGSELEPNPTVTVAGTILTQDVDYTVSYADNVEIGTATVTVTGIGNYTGTATVTFVIAEETEEEEEDENDGEEPEQEEGEEDHQTESPDTNESVDAPGVQSWIGNLFDFFSGIFGEGSSTGSSGSSSDSSSDSSSGSTSGSSGGTTSSSDSASTETAIGTVDVSEANLCNVTDSTANANAAFLNNTVLELKSLILTEEELAIVDAGTTGYVYLEVVDCDLEAGQVSADEIALVDAVKGDAVIGTWYDISLYKKFGDGSAVRITETNGPVTITMSLPLELINTDAAVVRTYQIARIHDGEATLLACTYDAATGLLSFKSDRFSRYAILYTDVAAGETDGTVFSAGAGSSVSATGDSGNLMLWLALLLVSGAGLGTAVGVYVVRFRRRRGS